MSEKRKRGWHTEETREALIRQARMQFGKLGYARTAIDEIVRQEQFTKGAMYYYFKDKRGLFEQVVDRLLEEMVSRVTGAIADETGAWERTVKGIDTYLEGCLEPEYRQIVLREAPAVLGWDTWREKEDRSVMLLATGLLSELMAQNVIRQQPVAIPGRIVFGAITEAALGIAEAEAPEAARIQARRILEELVKGL